MNAHLLTATHGRRIYLHWTATGYDWIRPGHYHVIVSGGTLNIRDFRKGTDFIQHGDAMTSSDVQLDIEGFMGLPTSRRAIKP